MRLLPLIPLAGALLISGCRGEISVAAQESQRRAAAYDASQQFVVDRLRAPRSREVAGRRSRMTGGADFPLYEPGLVTQETERRYTVRAYLEAHTASGTLARARYTCRMEYLPGQDTFRLLEVRLHEE